MNNLIFIFGEDTFRSFEYLRALKRKYIDKSLGDTNLSVLNGAEIERVNQLSQAFLALPFLAPKRLLIVSGLIKENKRLASEAADLLDKIPASSWVVFYERGKPDQRNRLVKELKRQAVIKEFRQLQPYELKEWVKRRLSQADKAIEPAALELLIRYKNLNIGAISQEIVKLSLTNQSQITARDIKQLVKPSFSDRVYQLTDLFLTKPTRLDLLRQIDRLRAGGENEILIFFALVNFIRSLLLASRHPSRNFRRLMAEFGFNYYLAKRVSQVQLPEAKELRDLYRQLLDYDFEIKTGKIEIGLALDLIVCQWASLVKGAGYASSFG
jgi:DNA polymerase-3 subunit delta